MEWGAGPGVAGHVAPAVKLLATSVVRGNHVVQSRGGVFLIDLEQQSVRQALDLDTCEITWRGRGGERGFRGIAFADETVFLLAGDELFAYTPDFQRVASWRNRYLKHAETLAVYDRKLFIAATGCDSILAFDLDQRAFTWAMQVKELEFQFQGSVFDPALDTGPLTLDKLHINNVYCDPNGMYLSGLHTGGLLHFNGKTVLMSAELPPGCHDARPFRDGVLFNDSEAGAVRYSGRTTDREDRALPVPSFRPDTLLHRDKDSSGIAREALARAGFARGLCALSDTLIAGGCSPSTISVYDLAANSRLLSVSLSMDVRSAIHSLAVWPYP